MTEPGAFVPDDFVAPLALDHPSFRLRPLGVKHNRSDFQAWTGSMEHIHRTPGFSADGWPHPMSLDQNRADLARHADDFAARTGFTYTVLAVRTEEVIGCVYIYPAKEGLGAEVRSWVRVRDADLDRALFDAVSAWLARDWPFESVAYAARPADRPA